MMMLRRQKPHAIDASSSLERDVLASDAPRNFKASSPAGVDTVWGGSESTVVAVRNRAHSFVADHAGRVFSTRSTVEHRGGEGDDDDALAVLELVDRRRHSVARARNKSIEVVARALEMFLERAAEEDLCAINLNQTVHDNLIYAL